MQLIKNREEIGSRLFYLGIVLELMVMGTDNCASFTLPYRGRVTHIAFILFIIKILTTEYRKKEVILFALLGALGTISYLTCDDEYIIRCIVMVAAAKALDVNKLLRIVLIVSIASSAIIVLLAMLGVCGTIVDVRHYGRGIEEARYCFGFNHANNVHDMYWYILSIYVLLANRKYRIYEYIAWTIANIGLYLLTLSRTGAIAVQILIVFLMLNQYIPVVGGLRLAQIGCFGATVVATALTLHSADYNIYQSRLVEKLDPILTGRLEMVYEFANYKDWVLFPPARSASMVDNGFATTVYVYGIVVAILLLSVIIYEIMYTVRKNDTQLAIILLSAIMILFMEATFIINVSLLCNMLLIIVMCNMKKDDLIHEQGAADYSGL